MASQRFFQNNLNKIIMLILDLEKELIFSNPRKEVKIRINRNNSNKNLIKSHILTSSRNLRMKLGAKKEFGDNNKRNDCFVLFFSYLFLQRNF